MFISAFLSPYGQPAGKVDDNCSVPSVHLVGSDPFCKMKSFLIQRSIAETYPLTSALRISKPVHQRSICSPDPAAVLHPLCHHFWMFLFARHSTKDPLERCRTHSSQQCHQVNASFNATDELLYLRFFSSSDPLLSKMASMIGRWNAIASCPRCRPGNLAGAG